MRFLCLAAKQMPVTAEGWLARLGNEAPAAETRLAFDRWLEREPENRRAWDEVCTIWTVVEPLRSDPGLIKVRQDAIARRPNLILPRIAAGILALATISGALLFGHHQRTQDAIAAPQIARAKLETARRFVNPPGKQTRILLADGTIVFLDADSALEISYSEHRRAVLLPRGRALFQVAKNAARPFVVTAAGRGVTALGTRFSVDIQQEGVRVVLAEGKVRIDDRSQRATHPPIDMSAGHMLLAGSGPVWRAVPVAAEQMLSWTDGQLLFDDAFLIDVVAEVNRYSAVKIVIEDAALNGGRLSAVLRAGDIETLLDGIARLRLARVVRVLPDRVELRRLAPPPRPDRASAT